MTFTKLFSSITASTIWAEPDHTRIVWITMLAMADQHGRVWASIPGLANIARVTIEKCEEALSSLKSEDKYSRTKGNDGRRIEEIDGGWRLLNHSKYRAIRDEESIKESKRRYINARREAERVEKCRTEENAVDRSRANTEAEAEAEANTPHNPRKRGKRASAPCPDEVDPQVWEDWTALRSSKKAPVTQTVVESAKAEASKAGLSLEQFLRVWCLRGSQGLQADWIKPADRARVASGETAYQRTMRERMETFAPGAAARRPEAQMEVIDVDAKRLG